MNHSAVETAAASNNVVTRGRVSSAVLCLITANPERVEILPSGSTV